MHAYIPSHRTVTHDLPQGQSVPCSWCPRAVFHRYEELVDAAGNTVIEALCPACAGIALAAHLQKGASPSTPPARESPAGCQQRSFGKPKF